MTELDLARRAKAGDRTALAELLTEHAPQSYRLALHILRNCADAEDATQNAFVKAFTHLGRFDERRPFGPWLLRIVSHEALNLLRKDRTRFAFWQRQPTVEQSEETVESVVLVRAEQTELWQAVNRLNTNDRVVLTLSSFMGLSEGDVATALGIKPGTVKSRKHNALSRLRALVEREFPGLRHALPERPEPEGTSR